MSDPSPARLLRAALRDPRVGFSMGAWGALGEFLRDPDEPVSLTFDPTQALAATARGALHVLLKPTLQAVTWGARGRTGARTTALCVPEPEARIGVPGGLREIGPDRAAPREPDRGAILFELGLGTPYVRVCVRTAEPALIEVLRAGVGGSMLDPGSASAAALLRDSPHRVFLTAAGRLEVYQRIPCGDGARTPDGPHTHLLPELLASGHHWSPEAPIPDGLVPCLMLHATQEVGVD